MKKLVVTAFALLSFMNFASHADDKPVVDTTSVRHLNLNEVQVNASRTNAKVKDLPQKIDVITQRVIKASSATDVAGLLKRSSSVDIFQYPGVSAGIGIRGFSATTSSKYAVILIDGKPAGTDNLASIDLSNVERVEILKGPFSAQYGSDAMGGVVNIVTKNSTGEFAGSASLAYGSFQTTKANLNIGGSISELIDFDLVYAFHNQNKDYKIGDHNFYDKSAAKGILGKETYHARMVNSQFQKNNLNARLGFAIAEDWKLDLKSAYFKGDDIETPGNFWHTGGMDSKDIERYTNGLDFVGIIGAHKISFSPFYSKENTTNIDIDNDGFGNFESIYKNYGFQLNDAFQIGNHTFAFGIDNKTDKYESENYTISGDSEAPYQPDYKNIKTGIYGQFQFKLLDGRLNASIGGRGDFMKFRLESDNFLGNDSSSEKYDIFTKNIGLKYNILDNFSVHTTWGDAFLAPNAFQIAGAYSTSYVWDGTTYFTNYVGNADLEAEKSRTIDFGFNYKNFKKGIDFDITYFQTTHDDKIIEAYTPAFETTYANANKAEMNGIEVVASYDFGALTDYDYSLRLYLNYTHMIDATLEKEVGGETIEESMTYVRDNTASFGLEYDDLKGFSTRLNGRYIGHRYEDNSLKFNPDIRSDIVGDILRHPVSYVFDYSASYTFNEKYTLGMTVSNLLDENYTERDAYNMPGRAFMAKFSYKF